MQNRFVYTLENGNKVTNTVYIWCYYHGIWGSLDDFVENVTISDKNCYINVTLRMPSGTSDALNVRFL